MQLGASNLEEDVGLKPPAKQDSTVYTLFMRLDHPRTWIERMAWSCKLKDTNERFGTR